ncbi:AI-2E family transporter [Halorubrum ezzemoulense]|uniref:AI-2E family transporter n=1 Tax=Halorubrum ezzemoulense TaxID=337243 RepID=UPI00232B74DF|nr:AI-2E family transporter [Halorubrum ezzemoulense]MDB9280589.1 AI-2E family transporter [Halorubrum ezzemoulense]MDB9284232.1 AI-2E family transporter [Halorubrum ezzemoulense]
MVLNRQRLLGVLFVAMAALTAVALAEVLRTVLFAVTVAYVLYPLRQRLVGRGLSRRIACVVSTGVAFVGATLLVAPLLYTLYRRRSELIALLEGVPDLVPITVGGFQTVVEIAPYVAAAETWIRGVAIAVAGAAPVLVLEVVVFTFLVYGILYRPRAVEAAVFGVVPPEYHDIPTRLHERTRQTLYSIYVLQAATAAATFVLAVAVFRTLGYGSPVLLAVIAGVLQFIPVVGPSILIVALGALDFLVGATGRAAAVLVIGLVVVAFVPDAVIRTRLAGWTGKISPGLYFVGFVGGILTLGAVGVIVGPLAVSLLLEAIDMLSEHVDPTDSVGGDAGSTQ